MSEREISQTVKIDREISFHTMLLLEKRGVNGIFTDDFHGLVKFHAHSFVC